MRISLSSVTTRTQQLTRHSPFLARQFADKLTQSRLENGRFCASDQIISNPQNSELVKNLQGKISTLSCSILQLETQIENCRPHSNEWRLCFPERDRERESLVKVEILSMDGRSDYIENKLTELSLWVGIIKVITLHNKHNKKEKRVFIFIRACVREECTQGISVQSWCTVRLLFPSLSLLRGGVSWRLVVSGHYSLLWGALSV